MPHGEIVVDTLQTIALIVISVVVARPHSWIALALAVLALFAAFLGWRP